MPANTLPDIIDQKNNETSNNWIPETFEQKNQTSSNHQLSNSFASIASLSGLEVDEGEDRSHPLKVFFDE